MRRALVAVTFAALLGACSGGVSFSDDIVAAEATWLCDVPRFAYEDAAAIDAELAVRLETAGIERDAYDAFKAELERSKHLRIRVADAYAATCGGG